MVDVVVNQGALRSGDRLFDRLQLLGEVQTRTPGFNHLDDAAEVAFRAPQPLHDIGVCGMECLVCHMYILSWGRGYVNYLSLLWCAKILSSYLWTIFHPPATIRTKAHRSQLERDPLAMTQCPRWLRTLVQFIGTLWTLLGDSLQFLRLCLRFPTALAAENLFLRKQLALYQERHIAPR